MNQRTILIVDDDPDWRTILFDSLSNEYDVIAIGEFDLALRVIVNRLFELVVLDLRLQDREDSNSDGMILLAEIRKYDKNRERNTKVIVVSSYGTEKQKKRAFKEYNLDVYFEKQRFERNIFVNRVRQLMHEVTTGIEDS